MQERRKKETSKMPFVNDLNWKKLIKLDFVRSRNALTKPQPPPLPSKESTASSQLQSSDSLSSRTKADKMFLNSEHFNKYMALDSSVIHQGDLRVGLKDSQRFVRILSRSPDQDGELVSTEFPPFFFLGKKDNNLKIFI